MTGTDRTADINTLETSARQAIEALLTEFAYRIDHGMADRVHELFTQDATIRAPGLELEGRTRIAAQFGERASDRGRVSRHQWSNPRYETLGADEVRVTTLVQTFMHQLAEDESLPAPAPSYVVGDSVDIVCRDSGGCWHFRSRELHVVFRA